MSYVEPYNLWQRIEDRDDERAARAGRYDPKALITAEPGTRRRAPVVRAAEQGLFETVKVALEAGLSPNDPEVFREGGLLGMYYFWAVPKFTELALKHGADPDTCAIGSVDLSTRTMCVARYLVTRLREDPFQDASLECDMAKSLALVLKAGSVRADVGPHADLGTPVPTAAWLLATIDKRRPELDRLIADAIPLLKAAGCDIDNGWSQGWGGFATPVAAAIRRGRLEVARALIQAGARIDDDHICRDSSGSLTVSTLDEDARRNLGEGGPALVREMVMEKVLAESRAPGARPAVAVAERARRRRAVGV